jgi:transcription elongation factor Elf1
VSDSYDTIGDESTIECPHCGKEMCVQDVTTDGCLVVGHEDYCEHCGGYYEIVEVEYSATVYVKKVVKEAKP